MKSLKTIILIAALVIAYSRGSALANEKITIAGDPCSLPLVKKLVEGYNGKHKNTIEPEFKQVGCMLGVYNAANGYADIGVSTQNGLTPNLPKGAVNSLIAKAPIVLLINKSNPVDTLSYDQLKGIFSGEITNWKQVGGKDLEIKNIMLEPCVKYTMSKKIIPYGEDISTLKPEGKVNPVLYTNKIVAENEGGIGQQLYGYETDEVKVLKVDGILPDDETLSNGAYTFFEEYNIVTKGEPSGAARDLIDFARSEEGKKVIRGLKHVPSGG